MNKGTTSLTGHEHSMEKNNGSFFNELEILNELKHFLPAQAPLKDFVHHNTLHAFQDMKFDKAIRKASEMFGYKVSLSMDEYRALYESQHIREDILEKVLSERKGAGHVREWKDKVLYFIFEKQNPPRIGALRSNWKSQYQTDLDSLVHPILFRIVCSYLDQGISIWNFPVWQNGFLLSIKEMERNSFSSFFKTERVRKILADGAYEIPDLLKIIVGDESLYKQYLFDQQFGHPGWSGMVAYIEKDPQALLDPRKISLRDLIIFELLLEIDALDNQFGKKWLPLCNKLQNKPADLFSDVQVTELNEALSIWQEAYEWTYYDEVLASLKVPKKKKEIPAKSFQAMFCIDDRETSLRDYIEKFDSSCETFATPGFFSVEFYFQPENGKFYTKQCPAPVNPTYLIKELGLKGKADKEMKELNFNKKSYSLLPEWLISQTLGFWASAKLFLNIFIPTLSPATSSSFNHMDKFSQLTIENKNSERENDLQVGFTLEEMAERVEGLLKSIGLVKDFAPIVYVIGHGSSSVNNPHYAAYDCGACSGRPGSVNARVFCYMANHPWVRDLLNIRGLSIPEGTQFIGGIHDTCRDEICFYDEISLSPDNSLIHYQYHQEIFSKALDANSKERSRRFETVNTKSSLEKIHDKIKRRSVSLFEPRPELNHASNAVCIVGRRGLSQSIFFDKRAFMNSYDYAIDPEGKYLFNILKAAAPVCGGINLEYYFSRVDNQKLGAGTKLPHNVMGLFGVANGIDGDLRPGLPSQMIEVHDPIRLLMVVEHFPEVVLQTIKKAPETYEWFINDWVHLVVVNPETGELSLFKDHRFSKYIPLIQNVETVSNIATIIESSNSQENLPVYIIS